MFARISVCLIGSAMIAASSSAQIVNTTIDGMVITNEGYTLLTESMNAAPISGGSATTSDRVAETSTFHWWDGINLRDVPMTDNRGDVINVWVRAAPDAVYIAVGGPTAPFNSFNDQGAGASGDQGDLFIAIESEALSSPATSLTAAEGHVGFGQKAVDFNGWFPDVIFGVSFVDNGGGGGGRGRVEATTGMGGSSVALFDQAQGVAASGFVWFARINGAAAYDTHNQNAGEFEFRIPWTALGYDARPRQAGTIRVSAYTTQDFQSDVYDSAPGVGNGTVFEELGDCPGDPDSGGLLQACNPGSSFGSTASSNFSGGPFDAVPGQDSDSDTIEAYLVASYAAPCVGDADFDGDVDFADITTILTFWTNTYGQGTGYGDSDVNGIVSFGDVTTSLTFWNQNCP